MTWDEENRLSGINDNGKLGNGSFAQPLKLTAGGVNYGKLTAEQQKALDNYVKSLGLPPGPPTQQGIYATPEFTGDPYPSEVIKPVEENQEPPEGWPRNPVFNAPGDVPGPPVQFGPPVEPEAVEAAEGFTGIGMPENDILYFHLDHLGSTSYITNRNGSISQHVEYIAFAEVLFEEHSSSFSSPYLFNGKELDRETNLTYYGARYIDMKTSLWLNVDPLAEKFADQSPYNFCFNNPINLIDPDGRGSGDEEGVVTQTVSSTSTGNMKEVTFTRDFRLVPPSRDNFWGSSTTNSKTKEVNGTIDEFASYFGMTTNNLYNISATTTTKRRSGQYTDSKGNPVNSAVDGVKLTISEYTLTQTAKLAGIEKTQAPAQISTQELLTVQSFDVNINSKKEISLSFTGGNNVFANKNKAYNLAPQSLKMLISSLMGENGKILPAVSAKFQQQMSKQQEYNMQQEMNREKNMGHTAKYAPPPRR